jgi:hypothetical protein
MKKRSDEVLTGSFMSVGALVRASGLWPQEVTRMIKDGRLRAQKFGKAWAIRQEDAERLIQAQGKKDEKTA